ncbi:MAG: hypothetical protein GY952_06790 [Rhodobacteraceae bacterium]|nr:hypothetical protein [Paracoccaceae bacterium]
MTQLPPGFVLDQPAAAPSLPEGFVLDSPVAQPQQANIAGKADKEQDLLQTAGDAALSLGTGLRAGAEALVGLPGDLQQMVEIGYEAVRRELVDETPEEHARRLAIAESVSAPGFPATTDVQSATNQVIGEPRQPQTTAGEFARTIGEFAPAVAAGPGTAIQKAAVTLGAGGASELAGQETEGTAAEPFARAAGGLAGGLVSAGSLNRVARQALKSAPKEPAVKKITDQLYARLRSSGIRYTPPAFEKATQDLAVKLHSQGFRAGTAPKAFSIVDELIGNIGKQLDFDDLDSIRRAAGKVLVAPDETERAVARLVVEAIDDFSLAAPIINTAGRLSKDIRQLVLRARDFASRNIKQRKLNEAIEIASTRRAGFEAGLRNEFDKLLKSKTGRGWTAQERAAIKDVANGNIGRNAVRFASKFGVDFSKLGSNSSLLPGSAFGAGALAGEPLTGTAIVTGATVLRPVARAQTRMAAERAKKLIRIGKKAQKRLTAAQRQEASKTALRRLLLADPAAQQLTTGTP